MYSEIRSRQPAPPFLDVSEIGKCFKVYPQPYHRLMEWALLGRKSFHRPFWALQDVSFQLKQGEALGIVGRNGSGKSTLLQIVCGTMHGNRGRVAVNGKIAALLELGAGFNPDFSGRENVHLSGALHGLTRRQIDERFDAIASFADIGKKMEDPVRTYSSGMFVRLAFSIIAHVDADILIIDEALAVGDVFFTQKCMRFVKGFREKGILLFVSHDMGAVLNLCDRALWLDGGRARMFGNSREVSERYLESNFVEVGHAGKEVETLADGTGGLEPAGPATEEGVRVVDNLERSPGFKSGIAEITGLEMVPLDQPKRTLFNSGERVRLTVRARAHAPLKQPILGFSVKDRLGLELFGDNTLGFTENSPLSVPSGQCFEAVFEFKMPYLPTGEYSVMVSVADGNLETHVQHHWLHRGLVLHVYRSRIVWGLVGIDFDRVSMALRKDE